MANTLIYETRRLQFPLDTLVDALIELEDRQGHWPPNATVVGASIENLGGGNAVVLLSVHRPQSEQIEERRYTSPMLAAAIVNYCLTMRVPMPRNSSKSIQVFEDSIALVLENTVILRNRHEERSTLPAGSVRPAAIADSAGVRPAPIGDLGEPAPAAPAADTESPASPPEPTATPPDTA